MFKRLKTYLKYTKANKYISSVTVLDFANLIVKDALDVDKDLTYMKLNKLLYICII